MLHRSTIPAGWLLILTLTLVATPAAAQISSKQVRDRYEKQTKGSTKLEDLIKKLDSPDPDVRLAGVKALGESKEKKAIPYLIQAAGDPDMRVQAKAVDILGNMRAEDATLVLVQQLFRSDTDPLMKQRILAALGKIGDARAAQPIVEYLRRDLDSPMRGTAIFALGEIGSPESLEPLTQLAQAETDPNLRRLAGEAAAKVRQHQAVLNSEVKEPGKTFLEPKEPPPQQGQQ